MTTATLDPNPRSNLPPEPKPQRQTTLPNPKSPRSSLTERLETAAADMESSVDAILPFPVEDVVALKNSLAMLRRRIGNLPGHNENMQSLAQRLMACCETVAQMASEVGEHGHRTDHIVENTQQTCEDLEIVLAESYPRSLGRYRSTYPHQP